MKVEIGVLTSNAILMCQDLIILNVLSVFFSPSTDERVARTEPMLLFFFFFMIEYGKHFLTGLEILRVRA